MKKKVVDLLIIITLISAIVSISILVNHNLELAEGNEVISELSEIVKPEVEDDSNDHNEVIDNINSLKSDNEDFEAWLEIENSNINLPVMYKPDNLQYYLRKDFYQDYYIGGTPFIDERCNTNPQSDILIIYGHHMSDGSMFTDLLNFEDNDYYLNHKYINYYNDNSLQIYEVFAAIKTDLFNDNQIDYYENVDFIDKSNFDNYISDVTSNSLISTDIQIEYGDKILMLSTCSDHEDFGRMIVFAKRISKE